MDLKLRLNLGPVRERLTPILEAARAHRFWVETAALTILALAAAFSVGSAALARAAVLEERAAQLRLVHEGMALWAREFQPASPQESLYQRESLALLEALDLKSTEPLTLAQVISQRAEEVGIANLRIRLANPETVTAPPALEFADWAIESGPGALLVEFSGDIRDLVRLLGALPPQVGIASLEATGEQGVLRVTAVLLTRLLVARE